MSLQTYEEEDSDGDTVEYTFDGTKYDGAKSAELWKECDKSLTLRSAPEELDPESGCEVDSINLPSNELKPSC